MIFSDNVSYKYMEERKISPLELQDDNENEATNTTDETQYTDAIEFVEYSPENDLSIS
ncbi:hypothetical protein [Domibacillus epiphyticus]|uniref:hypothetical protein n=1 Tax=Domibacillus epiphyticus TaxID=1714355 RepID=UPI0013015321|nr:hypothetical protein [Domibacillus epiphyticus]